MQVRMICKQWRRSGLIPDLFDLEDITLLYLTGIAHLDIVFIVSHGWCRGYAFVTVLASGYFGQNESNQNGRYGSVDQFRPVRSSMYMPQKRVDNGMHEIHLIMW